MKKIYLFLLLLTSQGITFGQTQSLYYYANKCGIKIGTAVGGTAFYSNYDTGNTYDLTIRNNFNILVAENEMKFDAMEPTQGNFSFTNADILTSYATKYGKQVRGHTLCWHSQLPTWINAGLTNGVANGTFTRTTLMAALKNHITTIVTRYKGKVTQWDVLNEPFNDSPAGTLRTNIWQQVIGNDYIDSVFVWANRADTTAKLYLNDYGVELFNNTKATAMYNYVSGMKSRNIPITGVGLQCHFTVSSVDSTNLDKNIKRYASIGLEAIITELDIRIQIKNYTANSTLQLSNQAKNYRTMIHLSLNNPNCKTFMTWGFTDLYSWIPAFTINDTNPCDYALIFDSSYAPKPAYTSILNELYNHSLSTGTPVEQGNSTFKIKQYLNHISISSENIISQCQLFNSLGKMLFSSNFNNNQVDIPLSSIHDNFIILKTQLKNGQIIIRKILINQ